MVGLAAQVYRSVGFAEVSGSLRCVVTGPNTLVVIQRIETCSLKGSLVCDKTPGIVSKERSGEMSCTSLHGKTALVFHHQPRTWATNFYDVTEMQFTGLE